MVGNPEIFVGNFARRPPPGRRVLRPHSTSQPRWQGYLNVIISLSRARGIPSSGLFSTVFLLTPFVKTLNRSGTLFGGQLGNVVEVCNVCTATQSALYVKCIGTNVSWVTILYYGTWPHNIDRHMFRTLSAAVGHWYRTFCASHSSQRLLTTVHATQ